MLLNMNIFLLTGFVFFFSFFFFLLLFFFHFLFFFPFPPSLFSFSFSFFIPFPFFLIFPFSFYLFSFSIFLHRRNSEQKALTCSGAHCCFPSLTILGTDTDKWNSLESGFKLLAAVPRSVARLMNFAPSSVWSFHPWFDKSESY